MMFHVHQSVTTKSFESVITASGDTDVFVCLIYHFNWWIYHGLKEMWIVSGKSGSTTVFPIHQLAEQLESNVADISPAIHTLTSFLFTIKQNLSFNSLFSCILKLFFHSEIWFWNINKLFLGCDTKSKVGTKSSALKSATNKNILTLVSFRVLMKIWKLWLKNFSLAAFPKMKILMTLTVCKIKLILRNLLK